MHVTFLRISLQVSQLLLTGFQPCPAPGCSSGERLDPGTSSCSVFTELALGATSVTQPRVGSEEHPWTCHREAVQSHCVIPEFVPGMLASPAESQGAGLAPWESSAPHIPRAGNPGNGLFSLILHGFLLVTSPLPRQDNVTHPPPALRSLLEHRENCVEN